LWLGTKRKGEHALSRFKVKVAKLGELHRRGKEKGGWSRGVKVCMGGAAKMGGRPGNRGKKKKSPPALPKRQKVAEQTQKKNPPKSSQKRDQVL